MNKVKLKDIVTVKNGSTPSTSNSEYYDGDIIWITPKDLSSQNTRYIVRGERSITKEGLSSCSATLVPKGTILMSSRAPIGLLSIAGTELCTNQGFKNFVPDSTKIDSEFLYYYLKIKIADIDKLGSGTTFKEVSKSSIENLGLLIPEKVKEQQKIASVLSELDSKIELNNRINAELEAMAKTIYDYWFVQFDFPDAKGKPYKSSGGKMIWNEKLNREIPEGWEVKKLGAYASIKKGTLITEKTANTTGNIKVVSAGLDYSYFHSESNYPENTITISASGASAGYINFWREPIFACDCTTVRGKSIGDTLQILGFLKMRQEFIYNQARGSAQPHVYPKDIESILFPVPPTDLIHKYEEMVISGNQQIAINKNQNYQLASLRDWLLPMLMNGQVQVQSEGN
jgi:type I restriction enzyme S subunit